MRLWLVRLLGFALFAWVALLHGSPGAPRLAAQDAAARPVGTIKAISAKNITLTTDAGAEVAVEVQDGAKLVRISPGEKDLKNAVPLALGDLVPGDRILVRGKVGGDGKTVLAASVIAMSKTDLAAKHAGEREEWQKQSVGGLVSRVDPATSTITITSPALGAAKTVAVHLSKDTILRRYSRDSTRFDDAKPAPFDEIKPGDQLRARGTRTNDGSEIAAVELVSGTFRNIAGTVLAVDAARNTLTVHDLATKKSITVNFNSDSQLRKLPQPMAQRIAERLKGGAGGPANASPGRPSAGAPGGGAGDFQQAIARMPAASVADLAKGEAVMIVATEGTEEAVTAITLLAGVEPILEGSAKDSASTILSPWSLSSAPGGEGTQ